MLVRFVAPAVALCCLIAPRVDARNTPDLTPSFATIEAPGALYITPSGNGPTLASVGCTITVHLLDGFDQPIFPYPFQDIWVDDAGTGELNICPDGSVADADTAVDGTTTISGAIAGGGSTQSGLQVYIAGSPLERAPLAVEVNSPDLNADRVVNVADVGLFAGFYDAGTGFEADFNHDGVLNIADVGIFASHLGDACP